MALAKPPLERDAMTARNAFRDRDECSNRASHTPRPDGYHEFLEWCREMSKTHTQEQCPSCGYYVIWKERTPSDWNPAATPNRAADWYQTREHLARILWRAYSGSRPGEPDGWDEAARDYQAFWNMADAAMDYFDAAPEGGAA